MLKNTGIFLKKVLLLACDSSYTTIKCAVATQIDMLKLAG